MLPTHSRSPKKGSSVSTIVAVVLSLALVLQFGYFRSQANDLLGEIGDLSKNLAEAHFKRQDLVLRREEDQKSLQKAVAASEALEKEKKELASSHEERQHESSLAADHLRDSVNDLSNRLQQTQDKVKDLEKLKEVQTADLAKQNDEINTLRGQLEDCHKKLKDAEEKSKDEEESSDSTVDSGTGNIQGGVTESSNTRDSTTTTTTQ